MGRLLLFIALAFSASVFAQSENINLDEVNLSDLLDLNVVTTAKVRAESTFDAPGIVTIMTSEEIRRFGGNNLQDLIRRLNGIYTTGSGLFRNGPLATRGDLSTHYNNHTLILIDGRPIRDSALNNDTATLRAFPIDVIERLEFVRGPGSVLYGSNAFSGVINVITKTKADNTGRFGLGSENAQVARGAAGSGSAVAGFMYFNDDGQEMTMTDAQPVTAESRFMNQDMGGFGVYRKDGFKFTFFQGNVSEDNIGPLEKLPENWFFSRKTFLDFSYEHKWSENSTGSYFFTYNSHSTDFQGDPPVADERAESTDLLLETTQLFRINEQLELTVGGLASKNGATSNNARQALDEEAYSAYAQVRYQPIKSLGLIAGGQGNKVYAQDYVDFVPRFGAIWNQDNKWGAKILYGSAFRSPTAVERFINSGAAVQGDPNLKPEKVTTLDVQLLARISDFSLGLSWFKSDYKEAIGRSNEIRNGLSSNYYSNNVDRDISGFELDGKWIPTSRTIVTFGGLMQNNDDNGVDDNALTPNTIVKLGASYNFDFGLTLGAFDSYYSKPDKVVGTVRNPEQEDYHYVTLNVNLDLEKAAGIKDSSIEGYANNVIGKEIWHPAFNRRSINTIEQEDGMAYYISYIRKF